MFRFDRSGGIAMANDWRLVDESRRAELRRLPKHGQTREHFYAFRLTANERGVPFLAHKTFRGPGFRNPEWAFRYFGKLSFYEVPDVPEYEFASATERAELLLLAIEALLFYETFLLQTDLPADYIRVHAEVDGEARIFALSDFGYDAKEPMGPN